MTERVRPGDCFAGLRRRAGEALAEERTTGDSKTAWMKLRAIDCELWPVIQDALAQCAGLPRRDGTRNTASGKLHPEIAKLLFDTIEAGLAGKLPPSWPAPNGHRAVWRNDAEPQAVAALYRAAVERGLISDPRPTQTVAELFGVSDRAPPQWREQYNVTITEDDDGGRVLSCAGLTIHHNAAGRTALSQLLAKELKLAAMAFMETRWKTKG